MLSNLLLRRARWLALSVLLSVPPTYSPALSEEPVPLRDIVVTPSHFNAPRDRVGSTVSVFDQTDLDRRGNRSVSDTLRRLPGITVSRSGGPGQLTSIRLRGTESNHVLVMIDGVEVNDPASADAYYVDALTIDDLARIEVLRGPQSSLYGTEAPGGVILLSSRAPGGPLESTARAEFGSRATRHLHVGANGQVGRLGLSIGAGWHRTDGISALDDGQADLEADGSEARTIRLRADVPLGAVTIDGVLMGHANDVEYDGYQQPNATGYRGDRESTLGRFGVDWSPGKLPFTARIGVSRSRRTSADVTPFSVTRTKGGRTKVSALATMDLPTLPAVPFDHALAMVAETERETQSSTVWANAGASRTRGYGLEYRIDAGGPFAASLNVRSNASARFGTTGSWRAAMSWKAPGAIGRIHVSVGTGVQKPSLTELVGWPTGFSRFIGNPGLEPERVRGWDVGLERAWFARRLRTDLTVFANRVRDLIDGFTACNADQFDYCPATAEVPVNTAVNLPGTTRTHGIEFELRGALRPALDVQGAISVLRTRDPSGLALVRRPRYQASIGLEYRAQFTTLPLTVRLDARRNGRQRDLAFDLGGVPVTLDSYTVVDAALDLAYSSRVSLYARAENLFDEDYEEVRGYGSPGLGVFVGLRMRADGG